jgi:hypothetical protein
VKNVQLMTNSGGVMKKIKKKPLPSKKERALSGKQLPVGELTASQQRLLQLLITGIEDEPNVLAGRR